MSDRPSKPKEMHWVNTYIVVKDPKKALEFYENVFGFKTTMTMPGPSGDIMHAEMQYRDCVIMLGPEDEMTDSKSPSTLSGSPVGFYLYVDDVDGFFEKVKDSGAKVVAKPETKFWGDRVFSVHCPEGHQWTFSQNVADFDPANVPQ